MSRLLLPLAFALAIAARPRGARAQRVEDPRTVVRRASLATQGDSAAPLAAGWRARLLRDSTDRAAALGSATLARLAYDYPSAERLYRRLAADDALHPDRWAAYARLGLAEELETRSLGSEARAQFERARTVARAARDRTAEGEAFLWLTFVRGRLEGVAVAEALLDSAERLIPDTALALRAECGNRRAVIHVLRGLPDAAAQAESSIALARRARDLRAEADGFRVLGTVRQYRGELDSALVALRRAEALYHRARDRSALARSLIWQAQVLGREGEYGQMREVMRRALAEGTATHNPGAVGDAYRAFGALAIMLGDFPSAADDLERSVAISVQTGDSSGARTTRAFLADVALAAGDLGQARRLALEQLAFARRTQPSTQYEALRTLAAIAMRDRDWPAAERAIAEARALLPLLPGAGYRQWLVHDEGRLALARGDLAGAERSFLAYLEREQGGEGEYHVRYDARMRLADVYARRGQVDRAHREMATAADELDRWRATLSDAELRVFVYQASSMQHAASTEVAERDARVARVIGALASHGRAEAAFALAERRRARELRDRLVRAEALSERAAIARASAAAREPVPLTVRELVARIPDERTALVEFVGGVDGAPTTVFVAQRAGFRTRVLPPVDSLGERLERVATLLEGGGEPRVLSRALAAALLDPALSLVDPRVARLVIVPDGALHQVPWDALRLRDGRFVVERYSVSVAPAAGVVAALWRRARARAPALARSVRLLAFGDPAFPEERPRDGAVAVRSAAAQTYRSAFGAAGGIPRLPASAEETRRIARYASDAEVRLRERASAAYLKHARLDAFDVIHLATHALVDERSAARTALVLAPGGGESGFVGVGELAGLRLAADLVVLSACRTARGRVVGGEGVQGLTAPLLAAGARAVVATRWRIGDRSTVAFVDDFYRALARGLPVSDALRAARLEAIHRGAPPREWAAFVAVGDPLVAIPLHAPASSARWWIAALVAAVAGSVAIRARRRRNA